MTDHRTYRVTWSDPDNEFIGTCDEYPSLSWLDADPVETAVGICRVVTDVETDIATEN